jgi:hypothetical protein
MAGELWRSSFQIGKETTPGTAVAATRKMYFNTADSQLSGPAKPSTQHKFAVQRRSSQLAITRGSIQPGGTVKLPLSSDECLELYAIGVQGGVTPATGVYTFKPGNANPDASTLEWHDGANQWKMAGAYANTLRWQGSVEQDNTLEATLFGHVHSGLGDAPVYRRAWRNAWHHRRHGDADQLGRDLRESP